MSVIQRMPAGPGLKPPTLLMSEFGVVHIVEETKTGYTVRLRDGSTRDLLYGQLRTSVTEAGAHWEFGFANVDRFSTAAEMLAEHKDKIGEKDWLPDLYRLLTEIINQIKPGLPIPILHPPSHLEGTEDFFGESDMNAQFNQRDWSVSISPRVFRLKKEEALAELAGDLFHELRHAEQYFVGARIFAKDYQTSKKRPRESAEEIIETELGLPPKICRLAVASLKQWPVTTEEEMEEGVQLFSALTTSLERGSQTKLDIVRLREIEGQGAQILRDIARVEDNIKKLKERAEPFDKLTPQQTEQVLDFSFKELEECKNKMAVLQQRRDAQEGKVNQIQAEYFTDPTERDAAVLGREFTAEFSRIAGLKVGQPGKGPGKPPGDKSGGPPPAKIQINLAPVRELDYNAAIAGIRRDLPDQGRQEGVRGNIYPGYTLTPAQIAAIGGRTVLPTVSDGDCFINAVFESLGRPSNPRVLRAQIANEARRRELVDHRGGQNLLQPGDWSQSDIALTLIAQSLPARITILHADGHPEQIGPDGARDSVTLVHIPGATPHYYGTRP